MIRFRPMVFWPCYFSGQDIAEAVVVSDLVAPEHLEIQTEDSQKVADR